MSSITDRLPFGRGRRSQEPNRGPGGEPDPGNPQRDQQEDDDFFLEMTLQEHLEELRVRILYSVVGILIALMAGIYFSERVLVLIADQANVPNSQIQTINPTEGFITWFKVALYIAIAIAMPLLTYQVLAFIAPGLTRGERRWLYMSMPVVTVLFVAGVAFAFFVAIPRALDFLSQFQSDIFKWDPRASDLISFYLRLMIGMGIAFELPVAIFVLSKIGVVNTRMLSRGRKIAFILVVIAAAVITPTPDPFNMMLIAIPIYLLYELGVFFSRFA